MIYFINDLQPGKYQFLIKRVQYCKYYYGSSNVVNLFLLVNKL